METAIAFLAGIFTGYILTWPALIALFIIGLLFEHNGNTGWAITLGIITAFVAYLFFKLSFAAIMLYSLAYFGIGIVWSFWRYGRFVRAKVAEIKANSSIKKENYETEAAKLRPANHLGRITSWVIVWPISVADMAVGDIISIVEYGIKNVFKKVYNKIHSSLVADLK